jgi:phosphoribosylglycinamide formyltransferase-1
MSLRFAVLISGRGSNMLALERATRDGRIDGGIVSVISDRADALGLEAARRSDSKVQSLRRARRDREALGCAFGTHPGARRGAGGACRISCAFSPANSCANGRDGCSISTLPCCRLSAGCTHRRVLEAGEPVHGCTVHFVVEELDAGPAVIQGRLAVRPGEDENTLSARVQRLEHIIYPRAVGWFAAGRLAWRDGAALLDGSAPGPVIVEEEDS